MTNKRSLNNNNIIYHHQSRSSTRRHSHSLSSYLSQYWITLQRFQALVKDVSRYTCTCTLKLILQRYCRKSWIKGRTKLSDLDTATFKCVRETVGRGHTVILLDIFVSTCTCSIKLFNIHAVFWIARTEKVKHTNDKQKCVTFSHKKYQ